MAVRNHLDWVFEFRGIHSWHLTYPSQRASRNWLWYAQLQVMRLVRRYSPDWEYGDGFPAKPPSCVLAAGPPPPGRVA
jgi:hypothetical protein